MHCSTNYTLSTLCTWQLPPSCWTRVLSYLVSLLVSLSWAPVHSCTTILFYHSLPSWCHSHEKGYQALSFSVLWAMGPGNKVSLLYFTVDCPGWLVWGILVLDTNLENVMHPRQYNILERCTLVPKPETKLQAEITLETFHTACLLLLQVQYWKWGLLWPGTKTRIVRKA